MSGGHLNNTANGRPQMGNVSGATIPNLNLDSFSTTVDTNVKGAVLFTHAITRAMQKQETLNYTSRHGTRSLGRGSIVLLGSVSSYVTAPGMLPYVTSKHAIVGITKSAGECRTLWKLVALVLFGRSFK